MPSNIPSNYYDILARIESGNNPLAKASSSSASGLFQFTKPTFTSLGFDWANVFDVNTQNAAIEKLTNQNANILTTNGIPVDSASLYAAHFLGPTQAVNALQADNSTPLSNVVSQAAIIANPFLSGMTVGNFKDWLANKTTGVGQSSGDPVSDLIHGDFSKAGQDFLFGQGGVLNLGGIGGIGGLGTGGFLGLGSSPQRDKATSGSESIFQFIGNLFSINTGTRLTAVIIGVGLVIISIVFLTNTDKVIVQGAKAALAA